MSIWLAIRNLHRHVITVSAASFLIQLGEELWQQFRSLYLRALGADERMIGWSGTAEDALDSLFQYPGGWTADPLARGRSVGPYGFMRSQAIAPGATVGVLLFAITVREEGARP